MPQQKITKKYYFSVEGETEKWYFDWLQKIINSEPSAKYRISIDSKIEKNPLKRAKSITVLSKTEFTHVFDYESNEDVHTTQFLKTLDLLKESSNLNGKQIKYKLGYTNFTFELWIILHKADCNTFFSHRRDYLQPLNRAYGEQFETLDHYKHESNFKRVLSKLSVSDVEAAIQRAKSIMKRNVENGLVLHHYKGYQYYKENPSLNLWEVIEKILNDCI